jgi:tRNA pseudouridine synthase 10
MHEINHTSNTIKEKSESITTTLRSYGNNPMGVGVSPLTFVPAIAFRSLQGETEDKVKHYGCLCWSQEPVGSTLEDIQIRLEKHKFPLVIDQKTPLRVMHRRALAVRTRRVLSCRVTERLDDHYRTCPLC